MDTMSSLQFFDNPRFGNIRVLEEPDGKILFCGIDVARALGYLKPRNAISTHCPSALKRVGKVQTGIKADGSPALQNIAMLFISESDAFRLIIHSRMPAALEFERWVFDEVLPSIRHRGYYIAPGVNPEEEKEAKRLGFKERLALVRQIAKAPKWSAPILLDLLSPYLSPAAIKSLQGKPQAVGATELANSLRAKDQENPKISVKSQKGGI